MLTPTQRLKVDLMTYGVAIDDAARQQLQGEGPHKQPLTLADYASTSGVSIRLAGDIWVNAPISDFNPNFVTQPAGELACAARG